MAEALRRAWTVDEFFAWQERQPERYELVNGQPLKMRTGASNVHADIVVNLIGMLRAKLSGRCRPFTGDGAVETYPGQIRRPDVGVDCGRREGQAYTAADPRLVVEVLSPTTRDFDAFRKLEEYKSVTGLAHILYVEPNEPLVAFWSRDETGWRETQVSSLDATLELPSLGCKLSMAEIYDGVTFEPRVGASL
jgi:Uma2 family endonuclease